MNKGLKVLLLVLGAIVVFLLADDLIAKGLNSKPLLCTSTDNKGMENVHHGLLVDHYNCVLGDDKTIFKWETYSCPFAEAPVTGKKIKDKSKELDDFVCDETLGLEEIYEDQNNTYFFSCFKSDYVVVVEDDGTEIPVKEALQNGTITIFDLSLNNIDYIIQYKDIEEQPEN